MKYILVKNIDKTGLDTLVCETEIEGIDLWMVLDFDGHTCDEVVEYDNPPHPIPDNVSLKWFTKRGEYDMLRRLASRTGVDLTQFPTWDEMHGRRKRR